MCKYDRTRFYLPSLAEGNQDAFLDFYLECSPCAAKSAGESHEHDRTDCVYDAFEKIFVTAQSGLLYGLTGPYVHGAVHLESYRRWKLKDRRPKEVGSLDGDFPPTKDHRPDELEWDAKLTDTGLTEEEKKIVELRVVYRYSLEEIAVAIGVSRNTAQIRYERALEKIRRYLDGDSQEGDALEPRSG